jgi:hypothetical protein
MTTPLPVNGLEVWPEHLAELSERGPGNLEDDGFALLKAFTDENIYPDADVVIQYEVDIGTVFPTVHQRYETKWTQLDADEGANHTHTHDWADLAVIMVRDRKSHMVVANSAAATPATIELLGTARRGSVLSTGGNVPGLLITLHKNDWVDLYSGADTSFTDQQVIDCFPDAGIVWSAPEVDED